MAPGSDYNMKAAEAAEFLGLSTRKLAQLRQQGLGPPYVRCHGRNWYSLEDLILVLSALLQAGTSVARTENRTATMASENALAFMLLTPERTEKLTETKLADQTAYFQQTRVVVLYGLPGAGKTFVALSMALSIAAGHQWCGKRTKSGSVLYVAAEGLRGLQFRMQAYEGKHSIVAEHLQCLGQEFDLRSFVDIQELVSSAMEARDFHPDSLSWTRLPD